MYEKIDFMWWYMGIIKEGVLTEAGYAYAHLFHMMLELT